MSASERLLAMMCVSKQNYVKSYTGIKSTVMCGCYVKVLIRDEE